MECFVLFCFIVYIRSGRDSESEMGVWTFLKVYRNKDLSARLRWYTSKSWVLVGASQKLKIMKIKGSGALFWGLWAFDGQRKEGVRLIWRGDIDNLW